MKQILSKITGLFSLKKGIFLIACGLFMVSCDGDDIYKYVAEPDIRVILAQKTTWKDGTIVVTFTPSEEVTKYEYVLAKNGESIASFEDHSIAGIVSVENGDASEVTFTDIELGSEVNVYARGYMDVAEGTTITGASSSLLLNLPLSSTSTLEYSVRLVSENIASFTLKAGQSTYMISYSISSPGKFTEFKEDNQLDFEETPEDKIQYVYEREHVSVTRMDLTPETNYSFYYKGFNRFGDLISVEEVPFTTKSLSDNLPDITLEAIHEDACFQNYRIITNEYGGKSIVYGLPEGYFDAYYSNWAGDLIGFMENAATIPVEEGQPTINQMGEGTYEVSQLTAEMLGSPYEMSILMYDKEGKPARFRQIKYGYIIDMNLPLPEIKLSAEPIKDGARVTIDTDENTMGFYMVTIKVEPGYDPDTWTDDECKNALFNSAVYGYSFQYIDPQYRGEQITFDDVTQGFIFAGDKVTILMMAVNNNGGSFSSDIGCGPVLRHTYIGV